MRQEERPAQLLVGVADVHAQAQVHLDRLVELGGVERLQRPDGVERRVGALAVDLAARIEGGWTEFDVAIATPDMMGTVGKLGRILGPQGKMPSPKAGTITFDIGKAVGDVKSGKIEYRTDRTGIVHAALGKKSFDEQALVENYQAVLEEILRAKPSSAKGRYLRSITMASTMSPGIKLDTTRIRDLMEDAAAPAAAAV